MQENNYSSRSEKESLKRLEKAFSEFGESFRKKPIDLMGIIDLTKKFIEYHNLFKEVFPESVKQYDLKH